MEWLFKSLISLLLGSTAALAINQDSDRSFQKHSDGLSVSNSILDDQSAMSLVENELLYTHTSPSQIIELIAPFMSRAQIHLIAESQKDTLRSQKYSFSFGGFLISEAQMTLLYRDKKLIHYRLDLPDIRLAETPPRAEDFLALEHLGYSASEVLTQTKILIESGQTLVPAWHITQQQYNHIVELIIDAQTGVTYSDEIKSFEMAQVFEVNSEESFTQEVELPNLSSSTYLDGKYFSVFAPDTLAPRAKGQDGEFYFSPQNESEAVEFDQVQTYYSANRILEEFRQRFGYDPKDDHIIIRTNDVIRGFTDNALYTPAPAGPSIRIGKGSRQMQNLARDSDVVLHEYSHHIIYQSLKSASGQSGELHEGYADFFTYVINGDPYLAETTLPYQPYLRTALVDKHFGKNIKYDDPNNPNSKYFYGQLWSGVLWDLYKEIGDDFAQIAYESIYLLSGYSGYDDAWRAILLADAGLNPSLDLLGYGRYHCDILNIAVKRGYAIYVQKEDGTPCQIDLLAAASESRVSLPDEPLTEQKEEPSKDLSLFGKQCASIGLITPASAFLTRLLLLVGLCAPVLIGRFIRGDQ